LPKVLPEFCCRVEFWVPVKIALALAPGSSRVGMRYKVLLFLSHLLNP
jgi:hypothetical protein